MNDCVIILMMEVHFNVLKRIRNLYLIQHNKGGSLYSYRRINASTSKLFCNRCKSYEITVYFLLKKPIKKFLHKEVLTMNRINVIDIEFSGNSARADRPLSGKALELSGMIQKIVAYKYFTCIINDERTNSLYWCKIPVNRLLQRARVSTDKSGEKFIIAKPFSIAQAYKMIENGKLAKLCDRADIEKYSGSKYAEKVQDYLEKRFKIKFDKTVCDLDGAEWRGTEVKYWNSIKSSCDATFTAISTIHDRYNKIK